MVALSVLAAAVVSLSVPVPSMPVQPVTGGAAAPAPDQLRYTLPVDVPLTAVATGLWIAPEFLKSKLAPLDCRWCESNALDAAVRAQLRWSDRASTAVTLSNVGAYAVAPLVAFGGLALAVMHEGRARNLAVDFLLTAEAVALAGDLGQLVRYSVGRQRPYAHAGLPNPDPNQGPDDANLSFFSGHTSFTFAVAGAAGTVARLRGYRWAPVIYAVGGAVAAATAYLRIAADQHYLTDVVTGAVAGTAVGVGAPYLLHRPPAAGAATEGAPHVSSCGVPLIFPGGGGLGCAAFW